MTAQLRDRLDQILQAGQVGGLHAVAAVRGGQTVLEYYRTGEDFAWGDSLDVVEFGPGVLHDIRSVTKSVTVLLYGIALGEGLVPPPAEPLLQRFPQYPDLAADPRRARLTVEHALTMSLSVEWREGRRCVIGSADVLNPVSGRGHQIAWASSVNAAATRRASGASTASS